MARIDEYLRKLESVGANDLLLSSDRTPLYRAQSELLPLPGEGTLDDVSLRAALRELVNPDEWATLSAEQQLTFVVDVAPNLRVRGQCSIAEHGVTARLTRLRGAAASLGELQLPASFANFAAADSGMVIVTGPAGSGKTTLIAALCELVSERTVHLTELSSTVEYLHESRAAALSQRAIGRHCASFTSAIDTALDTDADVIACCSLFAEGVFERLVEAACAGVLVFAELPGQGSVLALEQLLSCAAEHQRGQLALDLAESLLAVISLDLLPKKTGGGRVPAAEVLLCTPNVAALVRDDKTSMLAGLLDREPGMQSMDRCLLDLATRGVIDGREAFARANDKRAFAAWG